MKKKKGGAFGKVPRVQFGGDPAQMKAALAAQYGADWERIADPGALKAYQAAQVQAHTAFWNKIAEDNKKQQQAALAEEERKKTEAKQRKLKGPGEQRDAGKVKVNQEALTYEPLSRQMEAGLAAIYGADWKKKASLQELQAYNRLVAAVEDQKKQQEELSLYEEARKELDDLQRENDSLLRSGIHPFQVMSNRQQAGQLAAYLAAHKPEMAAKELGRAKMTGKGMLLAGKYIFPGAAPVFNAINNGVDAIEFAQNPNDPMNQTQVGSDVLSQFTSRRTKIKPFGLMGDVLNAYEIFGDTSNYKEGGIHINPEHAGDFTAFAQSIGMGVQEAAAHVLANRDQYSPERVKQANFARNAAGWRKQEGGEAGAAKQGYKAWGESLPRASYDTDQGTPVPIAYARGWSFPQAWGAVSTEGYKADSPDRFNAFNVIPSNQITMQGVPHPVLGVDNQGNHQLMLPGYQYQFPGRYVVERPLAAFGGQPIESYAKGGSFASAFAEARKTLGAGHLFEWNGKTYTTNVAGETGMVDDVRQPVQKVPPVQSYRSWDEIKAERQRQNALSDEGRIVSTYANTEDPYLIIDKKNALMKLYHGPNLVKSYEVGVGAHPGDAQTVTKLENGKTDWTAGNMSTGAGVYTISNKQAHNKDYFDAPSFNMVNDQGIEVATSLHGTPVARRWRFDNGTAEDNRMSNGCINGKCYDLEDLYHNQHLPTGAKMYVLPEDAGNQFQVVDGKPVLRVSPKNAAAYNSYTDSRGRVQKGQGVNRTTKTLAYQPIRATLNKADFERDVYQWNDLNDEEEYQNTTLPFVNGLTENKQKIMQAAQIPSDVYNEIAKVAFGIYGTESHFGDTHSAVGNFMRAANKFVNRSNNSSPDVKSKYSTYDADENTNSVGYTQIRWSQLNNDEKTALTKVGIQSNRDFLDPEKAAVATATILGVRYNQQLTPEQKKDILTHLPTKWNNRKNYSSRVRQNSRYLQLEQLENRAEGGTTGSPAFFNRFQLGGLRQNPFSFVPGSYSTPNPSLGFGPQPKVTDSMLPDSGMKQWGEQQVAEAQKLAPPAGVTDSNAYREQNFPVSYQKQWLQNYVGSAKYLERLQKEGFSAADALKEQQARLQNMGNVVVEYTDYIDAPAGYKKYGEFRTPNEPGENWNASSQSWKSLSPNPFSNPAGKLQLLSEYRRGHTISNPAFRTTPAHEYSHVVDASGARIPFATNLKIFNNTQQIGDNSRRINGLPFGYTNTPTEFLARMNSVRYLLDQQGIYNAGKQDFDPSFYDQMMNNPTIRNNRNFQQLFETLKGDDEEKKKRFIELMNTVAANDSGPSFPGGYADPMARFGGRVPYQQGGPVNETQAQKNWLLSYVQSPKYLERLKMEGFEDPGAEQQARLQNLQNVPLKYSRELAWNQGGYMPREYKGLKFKKGWAPAAPDPDPIFGIETPGMMYLNLQYRPGETPETKFATTPAHEYSHVLDDGDFRIPNQTIDKIHDYTNQQDADLVQLNGHTFGYKNDPSEVVARMQSIRYLLNKAKIHDAGMQDFDEAAYEKMLKDPTIQGNSDFQELFGMLKGNDMEKKKRFIDLMNTVASRSNGKGSTMARYGGVFSRGPGAGSRKSYGSLSGDPSGKFQDGGQPRRVAVVGKDYQPMGKKDGMELFYKDVATSLPMASGTGQGGTDYEEFLKKQLAAGVSPQELVDKRYIDKSRLPHYQQFYVPRRDIVYTDTPIPPPVPPPAYQPITSSMGSELYYPNNHLAAVYNFAIPNHVGDSSVANPNKKVARVTMVDKMGQPIPSQHYVIPANEFSNRFTNGVKTLRDTTGISQYLAPPPMQSGGPADNTGLYPFRMPNPYDINLYGRFMNGFLTPTSSPAPASTSVPGQFPGFQVFMQNRNVLSKDNPVSTDPDAFHLDPDIAAVGQMKGFRDFMKKKTILSKDNQNPFEVNAPFADPKGSTKTYWGPNVGAASGVVRGLSLFNNIAESDARNRYKQEELFRNLGDNKGALLPADWEERRGDYDVNSGQFRMDRMYPTQFGMAQMGGFFSEAMQSVPVTAAPQMPILPMPNVAAVPRDRSQGFDVPDIKVNHGVKPNRAAWDAFHYYVGERGLEPHVAAGIVGNLYQESGLQPTVREQGNTGNGRGIAQWDVRDRWKGLHNWAEKQGRDPYDLYTQLDYVLEEPGEGQKAMKALLKARTPEEASYVFGKIYERPSEKYAAWDVRAGIARKLFESQMTQMGSADNTDVAQVSQMGIADGADLQGISRMEQYQMGGEYVVTPEQLKRILAAGGEVEFV